MSFAFHGSGTRAEVLAQMGKVSVSRSKAGDLAREAVIAILSHDDDNPPGGGMEIRYTVKASGHDGGGIPASLNLVIEPLAVPAPDEARF
jgi:hypothetical protein